MTDAQREAAEQALIQWAKRRRQADAERDELVRFAVVRGVAKHRVHVLTGIARTTIDRIMSGEEGGQE